MGNACSCCSKKERSVEDLLDGSLEDKLLGKGEEDDVEATTAEEEAWRQRREQLKDEAEMSLNSLNSDDDDAEENEPREGDMTHASLIWDLSDRDTVQSARKEAVELVEDDEDEETFGSANEDANDEDDEADQESKDHVEEEFNDRLTQLSAEDSHASVDYFQREDTRLFRDTELDRATEVSDTILAPSSVTNSSFLVDEDDEVQKEEHEDDQAQSERRQSTDTSSRRKKKSRSRKSK